MTGIIYKYTSPSGKSYIGQTVRPEETKRKISEAQKGRVFSEEHKAKLSDIARNRPRDAKGHYIKSA